MGLSKELQIGKAGEHFVCCDLIMKGYNAFLADQGLPYDVLIDRNGTIKRIQVKTKSYARTFGKSINVYRFTMRTAKGNKRTIRSDNIDYVAFVFLDKQIVQYIPVSILSNQNGNLKQCIDFRESRRDTERIRSKYVIGEFSEI